MGRSEPLGVGVKRVALEEFERAAAGFFAPEEHFHNAVHVARKSIKRVRAILAAVRGDLGEKVYGYEDQFLRDTGRMLSEVRSAVAVTEVAVLIYFAKDIGRFISAWFRGLFSAEARKEKDYKLAWYVIIGSVPISVLGYLLKDEIRTSARNLWITATMLVVFGLLLGLADHRAKQQRDELRERTADGTHQLCAQRLARRQVRERLEAIRLEHPALDVPRLDDERLVRPRERVHRLGDRNGIVLRGHHARGPLEQPLHLGELRGQGEPCEPVLDHGVFGGHRAQLLAQLAQLLHGQPAVLRQEQRPDPVQPLAQLLDRLDLLLRRHDRSPA